MKNWESLLATVWSSRWSSGSFTRGRSLVCLFLGPMVLLHKSWRLRTRRCSSVLGGGDTHLVSGPASCGADRSTQPRRACTPRHPAGQRCDSRRGTPVVLRRHRHQQEAAAPALPEEGAPSVSGGSQIVPRKSLRANRSPPGGWLRRRSSQSTRNQRRSRTFFVLDKEAADRKTESFG